MSLKQDSSPKITVSLTKEFKHSLLTFPDYLNSNFLFKEDMFEDGYYLLEISLSFCFPDSRRNIPISCF